MLHKIDGCIGISFRSHWRISSEKWKKSDDDDDDNGNDDNTMFSNFLQIPSIFAGNKQKKNNDADAALNKYSFIRITLKTLFLGVINITYHT